MMTKFAVFFLASFAFQCILAAPNQQQQQEQLQQQIQQQQRQAQQLLNQIQASSNNAVNSVQGSVQEEQVRSNEGQNRQYLNSVANEYAYDLQNVAYNLQQAIQNYQGYQYQQQIRQAYRRLSEISYSVQQSINSQPEQLQSVLQNNVQNSAGEAQRLVQIIQQSQQQNQQNQDNQQQNLSEQQLLQEQYNLNYQAIQALNGILGASQRVQAQYQVRNQNQEQIRNQIQALVAQLSNSIQNVNAAANGQQNLANLAEQLSQNLGGIINRLQRQRNYYQQWEARNVLQQILDKLSEIRVNLEQAANSSQQSENPQQEQVQQLQNSLKTNINGAAAQIERLLELVSQPNNQSNNNQGQQQSNNNLVNNIVADALVAGQNLQSQLEVYAQSNQGQ